MTTDCEIKVFPLVARVGKIRRVAEVYGRKHGSDATGYWRAQVNQLSEHLSGLGCDGAEIERQLTAFKDAVKGELQRNASGKGAA